MQTIICSGCNEANHGLVVYSSAATGFASNSIIKNNGNTTFRDIVSIQDNHPLSMLHLGNCTVTNSALVVLVKMSMVEVQLLDILIVFVIFSVIMEIHILQIF